MRDLMYPYASMALKVKKKKNKKSKINNICIISFQ